MKRTIRRTYRIYRSMKSILADSDVRDCIEGAVGFGGMFVILFFLSVMF